MTALIDADISGLRYSCSGVNVAVMVAVIVAAASAFEFPLSDRRRRDPSRRRKSPLALVCSGPDTYLLIGIKTTRFR